MYYNFSSSKGDAMPFKLIATLLLVVLVAVLTGFNLSNKCTIWFFHDFENVPVFGALLGSFIAGVLVTLPSVFSKRPLLGSKKKSEKKEENSVQPYVENDGE